MFIPSALRSRAQYPSLLHVVLVIMREQDGSITLEQSHTGIKRCKPAFELSHTLLELRDIGLEHGDEILFSDRGGGTRAAVVRRSVAGSVSNRQCQCGSVESERGNGILPSTSLVEKLQEHPADHPFNCELDEICEGGEWRLLDVTSPSHGGYWKVKDADARSGLVSRER